MTALDQAPLHATMIRAADLVASPWKNGGGVTREIGAFPPGAALDAFAWRVSVADVGTAGPFSRFDGIDRTLVLLSGAGMTLAEAGGPRHVLDAPLARADFAGETAIDATLHDGATRDFNLMTRRSAARGTLDVWRAGGSPPCAGRYRAAVLRGRCGGRRPRRHALHAGRHGHVAARRAAACV